MDDKFGVFLMRTCISLLIVLFFSACSTQHDGLDRFVGKDIQDVMAAYGQPRVAFQMEENRRDFQWVMNSYHVPTYSISEGAIVTPSKQIEPGFDSQLITPMFNNASIASECVVTLMTRWDNDTAYWIVTGYQKPTTGCE